MKRIITSPVISIIVPVYKVEKYLRRCLDSIIAQTFTNFECILIDDDSPDNCPAICDEYAKKDSRFVVIHQENAGVSAARNAGLDKARGEWIGFVDSDDWCEPDMYAELYNLAMQSTVDVAACNFYIETENKTIFYPLVKKKIHVHEYKKEVISGYYGVVWRHLINKNLLLHERFNEEILHGEDYILISKIITLSKKIALSNKYLYHYNKVNPGSAMKLQNLKGLEEQYRAAIIVEQYLKESNFYNLYQKAISIRKLTIKNALIAYTLRMLKIEKEINKHWKNLRGLKSKILCLCSILISRMMR